ncbi:hypothetical protein PG985_014138 [Apiospora marii]|uniref:uncharacterized protein n=1 Tax=Apiospora marii TaxID=335849 RepID=UPI00313293F7
MGFINYEVDTVRFSCFHSACNASKFPATLLQNLQRITIVPRCWTRGCYPEWADFMTIDNFLQYVVAKYIPRLRELDIEIASEMDIGRQSFLSAPCRTDRAMGCPVRFFRTADGHGLQFLPTINDRGGWDAVRILIVKEHEAARFGGDEDHSENRVFLEFMGRCIWHVFKPEFFSKDDVDADQLIGSHRFTASW